jgi:hypothetical protein
VRRVINRVRPEHWAIILFFVLGTVLVARSGYRLAHRARDLRMPPPRQLDVMDIADTLTVPYIGRVYRVPASELFKALGVAPGSHMRSSLADIAKSQGRDSAQVVAICRQTVLDYRAAHSPPKQPPRPGSGSQVPRAPAKAAPP